MVGKIDEKEYQDGIMAGPVRSGNDVARKKDAK